MRDYSSAPIHRGDIYCSALCGHGCTKADFDRATAEADALARQMGPGWVPRVWENMGWHWSIKKAATTIRPTYRWGGSDRGQVLTGYEAWIAPTDLQIGNFCIQFIEKGETPEDALGFATQAARTAIARIEHALADQLEDA